jgi:hypothetical protein
MLVLLAKAARSGLVVVHATVSNFSEGYGSAVASCVGPCFFAVVKKMKRTTFGK